MQVAIKKNNADGIKVQSVFTIYKSVAILEIFCILKNIKLPNMNLPTAKKYFDWQLNKDSDFNELRHVVLATIDDTALGRDYTLYTNIHEFTGDNIILIPDRHDIILKTISRYRDVCALEQSKTSHMQNVNILKHNVL